MEETYQALLELQELDEQMEEAEEQVRRFEPQLEELDEPVAEIEQEVEAVRKRLEELKAEARRLERGAEEKRAKLEKYEDHLTRVRNEREEAAARAEIDLVRGAAEADEDDAVAVLEQITRTELKLDELEDRLEEARSEIGPRREELLEARKEAESQLEVLSDKRENYLVRLDDQAARMYERIRSGKTRVALAPLSGGACGHCFSMIPIQEQNEIRRAEKIHRCEACGVILFADD